jgi:phospholipid/cholesterol/gamma-HCH transport system permease protein
MMLFIMHGLQIHWGKIPAMSSPALHIAKLGGGFISFWRQRMLFLVFLKRALMTSLHRESLNRATLNTILKQVYFTAVQVLPGFTFFTLIFSAILIHIIVTTARDFGLESYAPGLIVDVLVWELLPLLTALFIALRSGAAINTEVALMKINNELDALQACGIDPIRFELAPRIIGGIISVLALVAVASAFAFVLGYFAVNGWHWRDVTGFTAAIGHSVSFAALIGLWLKCAVFGIIITAVPIAAGMDAPKKLFFAPIAVLSGMMRVFFAIMVVEVLALLLQTI